ncbi:MAG: DUF3999 family protein [Steroidobacteraceae bacterium]
MPISYTLRLEARRVACNATDLPLVIEMLRALNVARNSTRTLAELRWGKQHWRVRTSEAGGGVGEGVPRLEVSWIPSKVVFLARGKSPFKLLYGNADAPSLALTPDAILNPMGSQDVSRSGLLPGRATLEAGLLLGGPMRLKPAAASPDWRRWILWAVLLLGVGVLAVMAWRLFKPLG